jgi:UDP-N-acetylmuramyl pentapeptide phosphotransferase/UDP-N-acetylglucosamine-1-phosphate transferase
MHYVPQLAWILWLTFLSFSVSILLTPVMTWILYRNEVWKKVKDTAITGEKAPVFYKLHAAKHKRNIPTMAGVLIWGVVALITLLFNLSRSETWLLVFLIVTVGLLGLVDDYINIRSIGSGIAGIRSKVKMFWLLILSSIGAWWFYAKLGFDSIHVPGVGDFHIGILYVPLFILVVVASANAVNITDGLDGLSGGLLSIAFSSFAVLAYFHNLYGIAGFCATVVGAVLSYTWFNWICLFGGDTLGDHSDKLQEASRRKKSFLECPDPPPFRGDRLARNQGDDALLDHRRDYGNAGCDHRPDRQGTCLERNDRCRTESFATLFTLLIIPWPA